MPRRKPKGTEAIERAEQTILLRVPHLTSSSAKVLQVINLRYKPQSKLGPTQLPFDHFIILTRLLGNNLSILTPLSIHGINDSIRDAIYNKPLPGCWWDYYVELSRARSSYAPMLLDEFCAFTQLFNRPTDPDESIPTNPDESIPTDTGEPIPANMDGPVLTGPNADEPVSTDANKLAPTGLDSTTEYAIYMAREAQDILKNTGLKRLYDPSDSQPHPKRQKPDSPCKKTIQFPFPFASANKIKKNLPAADLGRTFTLGDGDGFLMKAPR